MTKTKAEMFKTAQIALACAGFPAGEFVSVKFLRVADNGVIWFEVSRDGRQTCLPEHQLTRFVL
jgi:hypothetical protein